MDNFWQRTMYFNYLSVFETAEVFHNADKVHAGAILTDNYLSDSLSCRLRLPNKYLPALINSRLFGRNLENRAAFRLLSDEHGHGLFGDANGCSDLCYEVNYTGMEETGDAALISLYLNKLLTLCSANNIPVILEQPPMNEASWTNLKESFVNDYTLYMEELQSDYPEIQINSQIPCYDDQYFGDSSHLNQKGAVLYSHALKIKYSEFFSLQ
ncbi:MAG TPA: hypothetical protein PLU43_04450, partial [Lachnospiraceae bacterium]|nr:hypothetical protein [Lachnospiraceae bacterium]